MRILEPKLTLVGAGPGDPDLISVKGIKSLAMADVVLYDALISKELLCYAPAHAELIYVGKRAGWHSHSQKDINDLIVHFAQSQGHVVRLKGGDPFIFGRGFEEISFARSHGLKTAIVPGISSAHAVPAMQHIPLTTRGINTSFWVITGTTSSGELSADIRLAAQSSATVVILMGMKKLDEITSIFMASDKSNLPVAVIQNGTLKNERIAKGTVQTIKKHVASQGLGAPAIIVIGETVALCDDQSLSALVTQENFEYHA